MWSKKISLRNRLKQILKILLGTLRYKKIPTTSRKFNAKEVDLSNPQIMDDIQLIIKNWKTNYPCNICLDMTPDFLVWRLLKNPILKYKIIGLYEDGKIFGFAIINTTGGIYSR